jgi:transposase
MQGYIATALRRQQQQQTHVQQRRKQGLALAHQAASILRQGFGVSRVVLFGSALSPTAFHETSDLDIAVQERHGVVDTLGLVMAVVVTAASVGDRDGRKQVLQTLHPMGVAMARIDLVWMDGGCCGVQFIQGTMAPLGWIVEVVQRPKEAKGFVLVKKRWIVERTLGWLRWSRRLVQDDEQRPENAEAMVKMAMIRIMVRRLA